MELPAREVAELPETPVPAVNSAMLRARAMVRVISRSRSTRWRGAG